MIVIESCPVEWARKHKIKSKTFKCPHCDAALKTSVPYVTKRSYGLMTPQHECDARLRGLSYVPKSTELFSSLAMLTRTFQHSNT